LSSNWTFRISQIMRNFWKVQSIIKITLFFHQIFFTVYVSNQRKKLFKMTTLTFRVGDHIFFIWYLKIMCHFIGIFGRNYWKYLENFPHFLFKNFKTYSYWILSWKYWEWLLSLYSNMSSFCFFALVYTLNRIFWSKTTVWQKSIEALFYPKLNKIYHTQTCQIGEQTHPPFKLYFI
jgi:hypothetical protein